MINSLDDICAYCLPLKFLKILIINERKMYGIVWWAFQPVWTSYSDTKGNCPWDDGGRGSDNSASLYFT